MAVDIDAAAPLEDWSGRCSTLVPTTPTTTAAAATPASPSAIVRSGRRRASGITVAPVGAGDRLACSAARLALIRSTR